MLITNQSEAQSLLTRLDNLVSESEEMRVLVGFFYFWGIQALHAGLRNNPKARLRILVGLQAEAQAGRVVEFAGTQDPEATDEERRRQFLDNLRSVMRGPEVDRQAFYERVTLFLDLVREGRIELRKTREPNHAKLYHFTLNADFARVLDRSYCWITGSSNMTRPGLKEQDELNVQLLDFGGEESRRYFDVLWERAVPLTDDPATRARIVELVGGDESLLAPVTPFEAYALVLKSYLEHRELQNLSPTIERVFAEPTEEGEPKYRPLSFQIDAINQALAILNEYRGVILADVVGLGKSVIASVLGRVSGKRGLVIAPPGLVGDYHDCTGWWGYLQDFGLRDWRVESRGRMEDVLAMVNRQRDFQLVVVDEAHYFRNQDCEDYHYLSQICRGKQVVLLTATPYSNRPSDMLSLLKLFSPARQSLLTPDGNLEALFRGYQSQYRLMDYVLKNIEDPRRAAAVERALAKLGIAQEPRPEHREKIRGRVRELCKGLARQIRQVVEPVMIRRNRLDLRADPVYAGEVGADLPAVRDPVEMFYALSPGQSAFYDQVIHEYFGENSAFHGAMYQPGAYVGGAADDGEAAEAEDGDGADLNTQQRNMYKFIRRLLVRRFESSFGAFERTLDNLIATHRAVHRLATPPPLGRGVIVLDRQLMDTLLSLEDAADEEVNELLSRYEAELAPEAVAGRRPYVQVYRVTEDFSEAGRERFDRELREDIKLLEKVREQVRALDLVANDPKARRLVDVLRQVLSGGHPEVVRRPDEPPRKVLVYSEFGDTVDHVRRYLDEAFPNRVMTIRSLGREIAGTVRKNFDGACNKGLQQDQYEVLLATDKMSEGFNLNRAGLVINYDIPWNPTRVIQRLGRINRIGTKVFNNLYLFNFFPTEQGAAQHNVRQIAANKMFMIHTSIGEDSKIFSADEEPTAAGLFEKLTQNPDTLEEISFLTQARREWADICERHPQVKAKLEKLPGRVKTAERRGRGATYLFTRKKMTLFALRHRAGEGGEEPIVHLPIQDALAEIRCAFDAERCGGFSADFWPVYESLQKDLAERHAGSHPGVTSLIAKARNVLTGAIARGVGGHFARILLDDLQNHGTLSDRTLRMIINAAATDAALEAMIETMKNQMGVGYLEAIKDQLPDNEIVVAVEHQVAHRPSAQGAAPGA